MRSAPLERFIKYLFIAPSGCWEWTGNTNKKGYGSFQLKEKQSIKAHRASLLLLRNITIEEGKEVDHLCRNRKCVNPDHLDIVTHKENIARSVKAKTHCINGHLYDTTNTILNKRGARECRTCRKIINQRYRLKQKDRI